LIKKECAYGTDATDYLSRARECLSSNLNSQLFYAAFELRCCIEQRQADYIEGLQHLSNRKVKRWNIGETSKRLHDVWDKPKISSIVFQFADGHEIQTYYTPVTKSLVKAAERELGELLHSLNLEADDVDAWLTAKRTRLIEIYREAWIACQGQHMAPPLWEASSGKAHPFLMKGGVEVKEIFERLELDIDGYRKVVLSIDYVDQPPSKWKCDL
jgi:hypothetical protein